MDTKSQEKLRLDGGLESPGRGAEKQKPKESKEVKKKTAEVLQADGIEDQEGLETGKVSEQTSEDKSTAPAASGGKTYSNDEIEAIRARLLKALPPQAVMIRQIRKKLVSDEKVLTKRMNKLRKKAHLHAYEMTKLVMQIRKIKEYFSMLAHATYEMIKHLWLKIVHGV